MWRSREEEKVEQLDSFNTLTEWLTASCKHMPLSCIVFMGVYIIESKPWCHFTDFIILALVFMDFKSVLALESTLNR